MTLLSQFKNIRTIPLSQDNELSLIQMSDIKATECGCECHQPESESYTLNLPQQLIIKNYFKEYIHLAYIFTTPWGITFLNSSLNLVLLLNIYNLLYVKGYLYSYIWNINFVLIVYASFIFKEISETSVFIFTRIDLVYLIISQFMQRHSNYSLSDTVLCQYFYDCF